MSPWGLLWCPALLMLSYRVVLLAPLGKCPSATCRLFVAAPLLQCQSRSNGREGDDGGGSLGLNAGVLVSAMRIVTKAIFPQDAHGLRNSANVYFGVSIAIMIICIICYNIADRLPIVKHYKDIKLQAQKEEINEKGLLSGKAWRSTLWDIIRRMKWFGIGIFLIYVVTLSIFPGYITEDVHSEVLKDWYPIILITGYNVFDLLGKTLPAVYLLENVNVAFAGSAARLLFYPLFLGCLHGPHFFRTEIPVTVLTCLLGLTNGYFTAILMILAPKSVPIQHAETSGIVIVVFLVLGLAVGSVVSWFWVI
ncbi:Equilibrative nucleoside transporter protein [Dioscorea alata]|uniref:Equilibrative nucleoside transporter protein n=1 Tax=Dioscorea alata TaxID=55571 RepID=A0ACB7W731_DIOAL|nr:Equilibrative nucleoside transporter protein [Dioscorea alata]